MEKVGIVSLKTSFNPSKTNQKYSRKQSFGNSITSIEKQAEKCPSSLKAFFSPLLHPIKFIKDFKAELVKLKELEIECAVARRTNELNQSINLNRHKLLLENQRLKRDVII